MSFLRGGLRMALFWENRLIDNDTGEIAYKKVNPSFQKVNQDGYLFKANSRKIVTYQNIDLPSTLQDHEIAKFYKLKNNIEKGSNFIRIKTYNGYRNATVDDLAEIWNVSARQAQRTLKNLCNNDVIAVMSVKMSTTEKALVVNPLYFNASSRINLTLYRAFEKQLKGYIPEYIVKEMMKEELKYL
jgi:hypothetical protein